MDILNPDRSFRIDAAVTGGATLYGRFPRPSEERKIENEILRRLDGHAASDYSENGDIPVRVRIAVELNVAINGASDPTLIEKIGDWEDLDDADLLVRISNEYFRLKNEFLARVADWGLERRGSPQSIAKRGSGTRSMDLPPDGTTSGRSESSGSVSTTETVPVSHAQLSGSERMGGSQNARPEYPSLEEPRIQSGAGAAAGGYGVPAGSTGHQRPHSGGSPEEPSASPDS